MAYTCIVPCPGIFTVLSMKACRSQCDHDHLHVSGNMAKQQSIVKGIMEIISTLQAQVKLDGHKLSYLPKFSTAKLHMFLKPAYYSC